MSGPQTTDAAAGTGRTPADAWAVLTAGNARFVSGEVQHPRQDADRRAELADGQRPLVAILGCSDSRLAAEIIFDLGLGDAFVVRNAGQVASDDVIGSLEYAVGVLGVSLVLVLGHDRCGAVQAAISSQGAEPPLLPAHIRALVERIVPSVRRATGAAASARLDVDAVDVPGVEREHVRSTVRELLERSEMIGEAVAAGTLAVVGAGYRLAEGRVETEVVVGRVER